MQVVHSRGAGRTVAALFVAVCFALLFGAVHAAGSAPNAASYVAVDLGTLGGAASEARFTNDDGDVVGSSTTASGESHVFLRSPTGAMSDLGPGSATGLNGNGQVVGLRPTPSGAFHGFVWTREGGMIDLSFPGAPSDPSRIVAAAYAENDAGEVAGVGVTSSGDYHAFVWTASSGLVDIGCLNGSGYCQATGISDAGHVAGECYVSGLIHACSWTSANGWIDLGSLGGDTHVWSYEQTGPVVNSSGQAIGYGVVDPAYDIHAFSATPAAGLIDLGTLGGNRSWANSVNDAGQVVGGSVTATGEVHPFSWTQAGGMVDLCGSASGSSSDAYAVNGGGQVVGACYLASGAYRAFLWSSAAGPIDLPGLGLGNGVAYDVSDNGKIVGTSFNAFNQPRATLWRVRDTTPPVLPKDVDVDASDPRGATVTYAATDDTDPHPTMLCVPASGTQFPIGTTIVACTATDASGNTARGTFTVHVRGAGEQVANLAALVNSYQLEGLGSSLSDKLTSATSLIAAGNPTMAVENLDAFIREVQGQAGKHLTATQAAALTAAAANVEHVLGVR